MHIFYQAEIGEEYIILDLQESTHCIKVLRSQLGDRVLVIDGKGGMYETEIIHAHAKSTKLRIIETKKEHHPLPYKLEIAIAPTKSIDRFEWFLEKATEIGVSEITPIICERSERKRIRFDRMEKVVVAAMKQSFKAYKPKLNEPILLKDWLKTKKEGYIAHCMEGEKLALNKVDLQGDICIAIGPEGDFSPEESKLAHERGFQGISLGDFRLRTETAGIVAVTTVSVCY